jgi:hypothetical protein
MDKHFELKNSFPDFDEDKLVPSEEIQNDLEQVRSSVIKNENDICIYNI